jgi:hypothetical protein
LFEEIANAARADADEHFDEVRTGDREERNARFARDRACQKCLTGARRAEQQNALRNACAERLEFLREFQEFHDLAELFFRFLDARHVVERDLGSILGKQLRPRASERQRLTAAALRLPQDE